MCGQVSLLIAVLIATLTPSSRRILMASMTRSTSAGDADHGVVEVGGAVERGRDPVDAGGAQALGGIAVHERAVGRDGDADVERARQLEDLPEVRAHHRLASREEQGRQASLAHLAHERDGLLVGELVGSRVPVGGHVAVVAEQVAAVGDVPDDIARAAELVGLDGAVLDRVERTLEEERSDVCHAGASYGRAPARGAPMCVRAHQYATREPRVRVVTIVAERG